MEILFNDSKMRRHCNSLALAKKAWGEVRGRKVLQRLDEMRDSDNLAVLMSLPAAKCHPLHGDRAGKWAVALEHPFRLIFAPANELLPRLGDGGLDRARITAVLILEVEDYHDKRAKK